MEKSTLIEILKTFSKNEMISFGDFVSSPYHNKRSNVTKLFKVISKYSPEFPADKISKEAAWKLIFPGKKYNYGIMKNLIHDLNKLAEEFIKLEYYSLDKMKGEYDLCYAIFRRNLFRILNTKYSSFEKRYNENNFRGSDLMSYQYYSTMADFSGIKAFTTIAYLPVPQAEPALILESDNTLYMLLLRSFHTIPNYCVGKQIGKDKYSRSNLLMELLEYLSSGYMETLLTKIKERSETAYNHINCYYTMFNAMKANSEIKDYLKFRDTLKNAAGKIFFEDLKIFIRCLTISLGNLSSPGINVPREMLDINNLMIDNNIFLEQNGFLKEIHFNKYIYYCCTCKEIAAAEKFMNKFYGKLRENTRENCLNYAQAEICFAKGEFDKSLSYLQKAVFVYFEMKYTVKGLELINLYELNDYESFLYQLDSCKHLAKNNKPLELKFTQNFIKFYNIVNELFQYRNNNGKPDLKLLRENIMNSFPFRKIWLLEKIDELERK